LASPIIKTTTWLRIVLRGIALALLLLLWAGVLAVIFWVVPQSPRFTVPASDQVLAGLSPDGNTLATLVEGIPGTSGGPIVLWNAETGQKLGVIGDRKNQFRTIVRFSPDNKLFAVREIKDYPKEELALFDLATLTKQASISVQTVVSTKPRICFSPDVRLIAFNTREKDEDCVKVWDLNPRQELSTIQGDDAPLMFFPDGKTVVIQKGFEIELRDVQNAQPRFPWLKELDVRDASPDGKFIATSTISETDPLLRQLKRGRGARANAVKVWELATQKEIATFEDESQPRFVSEGRLVTEHFDPNSREHRLRLWNLPDGKQAADLLVASGPDSHMEGMIAVPGTNLLVARVWGHLSLLGINSPGSGPQTTIYDTSTGNELRSVARWFGFINEFEISADGKTVAMESNDRSDFMGHPSVQIWDIPTRKSIKWILGLLSVPTVITVLLVWKWCIRKPRQAHPATEAASAS
jgi:WD40 repeat protein